MTASEKSIGLWESKTKDGKPYWSGTLPDGKKIALFTNDFKQPGDKRPAFNLKINEPKIQNVPFATKEKDQDEELPF